jgi:predicted transcriptional regulator/transcriptional regulator with XRE-family HTH domain
MPRETSVYVGPRLRRLRRDLGLKQSDMAEDLGISPSYVALLERNQRPLTADLLLRLARTYKIDVGAIARDDGAEYGARLQAVFRDPIFADLDIPALDTVDVSNNYASVTEAILRLYTAYKEEQSALADSGAGGADEADARDPVAESRSFLAARHNCFPGLDEAAERIAESLGDSARLADRLREKHRLRVRRLPAEVMGGFLRRLDRHREAVLLSDALDAAGQRFQLALQLAYLELRDEIAAIARQGSFRTESGERLTRRALASYAGAAILMPYGAFAKAVEDRRYDVEALSRQFGTSFEQVAHRLTTLRKPGQERVPFFFIRVDAAGNVSKRLDGAGFPFARHGGGCPLWTLHHAFRTPGEVLTQWIELPDGERFFSIARTVNSGGGTFGAPRVMRAVALGCAAEHAAKLVYTQGQPPAAMQAATPIGITCRLCHRMECPARSAPPIGRTVLPDDYLRTTAPFGFASE